MPRSTYRRFGLAMVSLIGLVLAGFYLHITNGMFDMSVLDVVKTLLGLESDENFRLVIFEFRLPRIIIAALVGIGLAMAGVVLQGITKNGLADPGILGINAGAGTAIVIFMYFFQFQAALSDGSSWMKIMMMPLFGFVGGAVAAALIFFFAMKKGHLDMQRLILTGIAINSGFGALTMFISLKMNDKYYESAAVWQAPSIMQTGHSSSPCCHGSSCLACTYTRRPICLTTSSLRKIQSSASASGSKGKKSSCCLRALGW